MLFRSLKDDKKRKVKKDLLRTSKQVSFFIFGTGFVLYIIIVNAIKNCGLL